MASEVKLKITGLQNARDVLRGLVPKLRRGALRTALRAGAKVVRDEAKRRVPVLKASTFSGASALRRGVRKVGTLKRAIATRASKRDTRAGNVGVYVNVKPLKGGSAKNPNDPFYWRWQEFGWNPSSGASGGARGAQGKRYRRALGKRGGAKAKPGAAFLRNAASKLPQALQAFEKSLAPAVQRFQSKGARA